MKLKVLFLLASCLLLMQNSRAQYEWEVINPPAMSNTYDIQVAPNGDIYLGFGEKGLWRLRNQREDWELLGLEGSVNGPIAINELGYIYVCVNSQGRQFLCRSVDDGKSWQNIFNDVGGSVLKTYPGGLMFGHGGDANTGNIIRSKDYGDTWKELMQIDNHCEFVFDLLIQNPDTIYFGITNFLNPGGGVFRSVDGGDHWENIGLTEHFVSSLAINSQGDLFAGTRGHYWEGLGGVHRLSSGQTEWETYLSPMDYLVTSLVINEEDKIFAGCSILAGRMGGVRLSEDNGQSWLDISSDSMHYYDTEGLFLDDEGYLYSYEIYSPRPISRTQNPTISDIEEESESKNRSYCYPNPFSGHTTFTLSSNQNYEKASINIYDLNGKKVASIPCQGKESIDWNGSDRNGTRLPDGVYFYNLSNGKYSSLSNKLLIQK